MLRPFTLDDAPRVRQLAGDARIADTTLRIPHPYPEGAAEEWIGTHAAAFGAGESAQFAVTLADSGELIGATGFEFSAAHNHAELGYWIGVAYWGKGYATEAGRALLEWGFRQRGVHRIHAHHFARNPASGRVMQKLGMRPEGCLRAHVRKNDRYEDCELYGILREEFGGG